MTAELGECSVDDNPVLHTMNHAKFMDKYGPIREASFLLAKAINENCPRREETRIACIKVEEALMWVTASLSRPPHCEPKPRSETCSELDTGNCSSSASSRFSFLASVFRRFADRLGSR